MPSLITPFTLFMSLKFMSKFPRSEFCTQTVASLYEPSFPCTVMVGETCAMRRRLVVFSGGGVFTWHCVGRSWLFNVVKEPLVTMSSANFTYKCTQMSDSIPIFSFNLECKNYMLLLSFCQPNNTLALKASTSDFSTRLFVSASRKCWLASLNCLYRVAFSTFSFSTWQNKINICRAFYIKYSYENFNIITTLYPLLKTYQIPATLGQPTALVFFFLTFWQNCD